MKGDCHDYECNNKRWIFRTVWTDAKKLSKRCGESKKITWRRDKKAFTRVQKWQNENWTLWHWAKWNKRKITIETLILEQSKRFKTELDKIVFFIEIDSPNRAFNFFEDIISKIEKIPNNPYIHRKRVEAKDENLRELIYKGYTVPFEIDNKNRKIIVLGIFNQNLWNYAWRKFQLLKTGTLGN